MHSSTKTYTGVIHGFSHVYESPVQYKWKISEHAIDLNPCLGRTITISFLGVIQCSYCGRKIKKTYDGFCYPCFKKLPQADLCIVKPHECHYHLGTCRDTEFAEAYCMIPHYVYLAVSSGVKVGLTRKHNEWKRWVDQGAVRAMPIAELPNRKSAGELEAALSKHLADKTDWRKMLKGEVPDTDLHTVREEVLPLFPDEWKEYALKDEADRRFEYPISEPVGKVVSLNLDKTPVITDRLIGIKGNYLLFDGGVLNVHKFVGYTVEVVLPAAEAE